MVKNLDFLIEKAKQLPPKVMAIAAAEDPFVMTAILRAKKIGIIKPVFIGNAPTIKSIASQLATDIPKNEIIDCPDPNKSCELAVKMVNDGKAHLLMKGLVSTGVLLKHVVSKEYGLLSGKLLSHLAIFESPNYHKIIGLTDAAMNIEPDLNDKSAIIQNAVKAFHSLGIDIPKVAVLTAVEKVNPKMQSTLDAAVLKTMNDRGQLKNCIIDGPLALDNAISPEAAKHKGIGGDVAGDADILIAPDLNAGNVLYKSLAFLGNAQCAAIIVGSTAPIVLTSRADTEETKFLSIALGVSTC